jgi:serine/threonine protein kinase
MGESMLVSGAVLQNRYLAIDHIAHGGMGRVYLAEDLRFPNSEVALKEARWETVDARKAFEREAELLYQLRHPALPHVTDYFIEGAKQYLVMQFIPGMTLEELLVERQKKGEGTFTPGQVLQWASQLLDALEYLHGHPQPIIHRDIKPQNLKLTPRGEVILLDFGLAKGAATEQLQAIESIRGYTRRYASLEQIEGKSTDPRSDLYALAATLYRLLTCSYPPDALSRASALLQGRPDPLIPADKLNPQVSAATASILTSAMALNPADRLGSAGEMRSAFQLRNPSEHNGTNSCVTRPPGTDITTSRVDQPDLSITAHATVPNLESTFVGQAIETDDFHQAPAVRSKDAIGSSGGRIWRAAPMIRAFIGVLVLVSGAFAYRYWNSEQVGNRESTGGSIASTPATGFDAMTEVMSYSLELEKTGKRVSGDVPLAPGALFKLHLSASRAGYLYLIAPDVNDVPTMFLTGLPNPGFGVKTNRIEPGEDFSFPPRADQWLRITGAASVETYLVIFTPNPIDGPDILTGRAGRKLSSDEVEALRRQFGQETRTEMSGGRTVIKAPAHSTGKLFAFDLRTETKRP